MNQDNQSSKSPRILFLEDSPRDAEIIREHLNVSGVALHMDWTSNEREFTALLQNASYDVVLADYRLVDFDAPAALRLTQTLCPGLPFICVSGAVGEEVAVELLKLGAVDYILKDRLERLPYAVERAIDDARARAARERAEEELNQQLNTKVKELEQVVYVASHDLRSPLVTIEGFCGVLEESLHEISTVIDKEALSKHGKAWLEPFFKDGREALQYISKAVSSMEVLLRGLLQISRLGREEIKKEHLDMNSLISDVLNNFKYQRESQGIRVEVAELPDCQGDGRQVNQLFSNLVGNAIKYCKPDLPCVIKISGEHTGERTVYCVEDNGVGIAPEYQEKIFSIFHQLNPEISGEGLGLSIVKKIVENHGGRVWVESEEGQGSRFYISL